MTVVNRLLVVLLVFTIIYGVSAQNNQYAGPGWFTCISDCFRDSAWYLKPTCPMVCSIFAIS